MKEIILTGASGFVGSQLKPYLENKQYSVVACSLRHPLTQQQLPNHANAIIHLAGKAHDTQNTSDPSSYFQINTELTKELFQWFLKSDVSDFIYFSSVKAAADTVADMLSENVIPQPLTPYGQSKLQAEQYLLAQSLPAGKRLLILRPCMIHGPGNKGNLNLLYNFVAKGVPYPLAAFENKRSFLSIQNLSYIVTSILQQPLVATGIYNIADDEAISTNQVVSIIAQTMNRKPMLWAVPKVLLQAAARLGNLFKLPLNSERLKKLTENYVVDNTKIKNALGIAKLPLSASEGLSVTISSFLRN